MSEQLRMASRQLPALVFRALPVVSPTQAPTSNDAFESPNWSSAGWTRRMLLVAVLLAEVVAVTLAIAGDAGALQA